MALHAIDSGTHTCSVVDAVGNVGMATIEINVIGVGISYDRIGVLQNNTFITTDSSGTIGVLRCISGSLQPNVGRWISPSGQDITTSIIDPFEVQAGDQNSPGSLIIRQASGHSITTSFQGVYTCIIPNERGVEKYLHIGIYSHSFNSKYSSSKVDQICCTMMYQYFKISCR